MMAYMSRIQRKSVDLDYTINYWVDRVEHLLRGCVRDRHIHGAEHSVDVQFHEFMADDIATAERILTRAGVPLTKTARNRGGSLSTS